MPDTQGFQALPRRTFLGGAAATAAWPAIGAERPINVLFVLADQWRFSAFSHKGDPVVHTPAFDRFAGESLHFARTYAANPVCTPNRSCILTGRYSHQHGMITNNIMLPPGERTIGETFSKAGYATHYIGKWHMDGPERPGFVPPGWRRRGFQTFEGFNRGHYYPTGAKYFTNEGKLLHPDVYEPTYQTDLAIAFLKRNRTHPFYCYLSWGPPHTPYRPPKEWQRYDPAKLGWRPNVPLDVRNNPRTRDWAAGYYGLCSSLDHELDRLLQALEAEGLAESTLVVFTADHGDMLGSHGMYYKTKPEEESLHVPLYMRLPGRIRGGQVSDTLVSSIDLTPTILSICGLKAPATVTGQDLSPAALGGTAPKVDFIYAEGQMRARARTGGAPLTAAADPEDAQNPGSVGVSGGMEWRAVVTHSHKLVVRADSSVGALFDLEKDPYEMKNLAGERSAAALQNDLLARMKRRAKETGDSFPAPCHAAKEMYTDEEAAKA